MDIDHETMVSYWPNSHITKHTLNMYNKNYNNCIDDIEYVG